MSRKIQTKSKTSKTTNKFKKLIKIHRVTFKSKNQAISYLAGIIDGEGNVDLTSKVVKITNTDLDILFASISALEKIGIVNWRVVSFPIPPENKNRTRKQNFIIYDIRIMRRKDIVKLKNLPLLHEDKYNKIQSIINLKYNKKRNGKLISKIVKWRNNKMTFVEIGNKLDISSKLAHKWYHSWVKNNDLINEKEMEYNG